MGSDNVVDSLVFMFLVVVNEVFGGGNNVGVFVILDYGSIDGIREVGIFGKGFKIMVIKRWMLYVYGWI